MGKQTKRTRKFLKSGGIQARLKKGTVTRHGKLRHRGGKRKDDNKPAKQEEKPTPRDRSDDFLGKNNIGDLDMDSFFTQFADSMEQQLEKEGEKKDQDDEKEENAPEEKDDDDKKAKKDDDSSSSSSDSSDDEEDIEASEERMKSEMAKMKTSDPEFHEFLKEHEESLLDFGNYEDDEDEEEQEAEDQDEDLAVEETGNDFRLTAKALRKLEHTAFDEHGIKSLRKLVGAYRSACHLADAAPDDETTKKQVGRNYIIESSKVFDELMLTCLNRFHEEFHYHLLGEGKDGVVEKKKKKKNDKEEKEQQEEDVIDENKPIQPKKLEQAARWDVFKILLFSFFRSTMHLMTQSKEPDLLTFTLKALSKYLRFLTPFPRLAQNMLRTLTSLWSAPLDSSEDYQVVRLNAFFRIRQLALTQPFPFIEDCLKKTYLAYAKRAKFGTASSVTSALPTLTFMGNCLVELYSLDYHSSYQHAFVYIRQLALHLRTAIQKQTAEAMQQVYCWQYVHCLKLWVAVLSAAAPTEDGALLRSLIYPISEVILGTIRNVPTPVKYVPLRFHCIRLLQQLAAASEMFIPTTSLLLDCLEWKEWSMPAKKTKSSSMSRGIQMHYIIRLPGKDDFLRTHEQLEAAINDFFLLLQREMELYRYSAGFPEFAVRIIVRLRQFIKHEAKRNSRWRAIAKACIEQCEIYSKAAVQARSKLLEAPKDVKRLECLKPVSEKSMRERHKELVDKESKKLDAGARPAPVPQKGKKRKQAKQEDEDDGSSEEGDQASKKKIKGSKKPKKEQEWPKKKTTQDVDVMEEEDKVQEGINWSDEED